MKRSRLRNRIVKQYLDLACEPEVVGGKNILLVVDVLTEVSSLCLPSMNRCPFPYVHDPIPRDHVNMVGKEVRRSTQFLPSG